MTEGSDSEIELSEDEFEGFASEDVETDNIELSAEESESVEESDIEDGLEEEVTPGYNGVGGPDTAETVSSVEITPLAPLVESAVRAADETELESAETEGGGSWEAAAAIISQLLADIPYSLTAGETSPDCSLKETPLVVQPCIEDVKEDSKVERSRNSSGESLSVPRGRVTRSKLSSDKESEGRWSHLRKRQPSNESTEAKEEAREHDRRALARQRLGAAAAKRW